MRTAAALAYGVAVLSVALTSGCTKDGGNVQCVDECPQTGIFGCASAAENGMVVCADFDDDPCLEWSDVITCPGGETCSNGTCASACVDECADGETVCEGDGFKTCGVHDSDSCRDWSPIEACGDGEICEDGHCLQVQCTEEGEDCICGNNECCEGHCCPFFFICVSFSPDEDVCF
jgi:hypothetical protein